MFSFQIVPSSFGVTGKTPLGEGPEMHRRAKEEQRKHRTCQKKRIPIPVLEPGPQEPYQLHQLGRPDTWGQALSFLEKQTLSSRPGPAVYTETPWFTFTLILCNKEQV